MFGLTVLISSPAQPKVNEFAIADFVHHIGLTDPQVSPDQRRVAYVRTSANEDLRYQFEIVLEDLAEDERSQLTTPSQHAHTPRWVSNGELSFLASTKDNGHQVFLLDVDNAELRQVTHHADPVQGYAWSPDGTQLAYASRPRKEPRLVKAFPVTNFSRSPPRDTSVPAPAGCFHQRGPKAARRIAACGPLVGNGLGSRRIQASVHAEKLRTLR